MADLLQPLNSPDPHVRQAGCQGLARPALRGDSRVASALAGRLQDRDQYVRQAAATSLGQVARRGDEASLAALAARLSDPDPGVRRVAVNALGQVATRGCPIAMGALLGRLEDKDGGVRRSTLKAIERIAEKGDTKVIAALFGRTADPEAFVRHAAVEVLARLAEEGDAEVVARLLVLLEGDRDARVRTAATDALGRLAMRGDSRVLAALLAGLDDESDGVRRAAANSLGHVTFAPLQELELQERQIAELEHRGKHEVASRDRAISEREERHMHEVLGMQRRIEELESTLRREVEERDRRIAELEAAAAERAWLSRVMEFIPPAGQVAQFIDSLPALAGVANYGTEVFVPVWALRCARGSGAEPTGRRCGRGGNTGPGGGGGAHAQGPAVPAASSPSGIFSSLTFEDVCPDGKDKREFMSLFELFEQLSLGNVTPMELTEKKPLDVYIHQGSDGHWGVYCCSRHRMLALLMRQACVRNEVLTVKCTLRPKDDQSFWSWQWSNFYDGGDGFSVHPFSSTAQPAALSPMSVGGNSPSVGSRFSLGRGGGSGVYPAPSGGGGVGATSSAPSTPRTPGSSTATGAAAWRGAGAVHRRPNGNMVAGGSLSVVAGARKQACAVAATARGAGEDVTPPARWSRSPGACGGSAVRNGVARSVSASARGTRESNDRFCIGTSAGRLGEQPGDQSMPKRLASQPHVLQSGAAAAAAASASSEMAACTAGAASNGGPQPQQHAVPTLTMDLGFESPHGSPVAFGGSASAMAPATLVS